MQRTQGKGRREESFAIRSLQLSLDASLLQLLRWVSRICYRMPHRAPRPNFSFLSNLSWFKDLFGTLAGCVGKILWARTASLSPYPSWSCWGWGVGRKPRVSWYILRSGRREEPRGWCERSPRYMVQLSTSVP